MIWSVNGFLDQSRVIFVVLPWHVMNVFSLWDIRAKIFPQGKKYCYIERKPNDTNWSWELSWFFRCVWWTYQNSKYLIQDDFITLKRSPCRKKFSSKRRWNLIQLSTRRPMYISAFPCEAQDEVVDLTLNGIYHANNRQL
jgi:hypothetical protein